MKKIRLGLQESISRKDVNAAAWRNNWIWQGVIEQDQENPFEIIWKSSQSSSSIHYIEDFYIELNYLYVIGNNIKKVVEQAKTSLLVYSFEDSIKKFNAADNIEEQVKCLKYIAITSPKSFNPKVYNLLDSLVRKGNATILQTIIIIVGYIGWTQCKNILKYIIQNNSDDKLQNNALLMLEASSNNN